MPPSLQPRTRGEHLWPSSSMPGRRFSPARAGNTLLAFTDAHLIYASAPHARGTQPGRHRKTEALRFSPARAGNTSPIECCDRRRPLQPRTRGEHLISSIRDRSTTLQPRTRGEHLRTSISASAPTLQPRTRGEHRLLMSVENWMPASAPHARGTRLVLFLGRERQRFSPARAGNTLLASCCDIENISSVSDLPTLS